MVIPAVFVFMGTEGMGAGPGLIFVALPKIFHSLGTFGPYLGLAFFLLILFAATTSAVSILEACVSSVMDAFHWGRTKSVIVLSMGGLIASVIVSLGYNVLYFEYTLPNGATAQILDIFDYVSNNLLMPFISISTCILIGWVVKPNLLIGEMRLNGYQFKRKPIYIIMLKYIVPLILTVLLLGAFGLY
jgi:NSS family neurotransmitter:Na+ symporter